MRNVLIYAGILGLSLGGAWFRWTKAPDTTTGSEVIILQGSADDIERIVWESSEEKSVLTIKEDAHSSYIWVEYTDNRPQTNTEDPQPIEKRFKGGTKAEQLLTKLSPLVGLRRFAELDTEQEESFGLTEPSATITITRRGRDQVLTIGGEAYGTKDWYVRSEETSTIFLLDDLNLKNLKFARNQLVDRHLWSIDNKKITGLELTFENQSTLFEHVNWQDPQNAHWKYAEQPELDNAQLTTWIEKFLKIKGNRYAEIDFDANLLSPQFSVSLSDANQASETIQFATDSDGSWWAQSEHTRGHLKVITQSIEPLFTDIEALRTATEDGPKSNSPESQ